MIKLSGKSAVTVLKRCGVCGKPIRIIPAYLTVEAEAKCDCYFKKYNNFEAAEQAND